MTRPRYAFLFVSLAALLALAFLPRVGPPPARPREAAEEGAEGRAAGLIELRIRAKDRIVGELADARRPLVEAAALFRELDRLPPATRYPLDAGPDPPAATEGELYCARVIRYARNSLRVTHPDRAEAVAGRLAAELRARAERGPVRLPEPTSLGPVHELLERARAGASQSRPPSPAQVNTKEGSD